MLSDSQTPVDAPPATRSTSYIKEHQTHVSSGDVQHVFSSCFNTHLNTALIESVDLRAHRCVARIRITGEFLR